MADKKKGKKQKKFYLVDYENVTKSGLDGIEELEKGDSVIIFYSKNADKLSFSLHSQIIETKADVSYYEAETIGKNALDFQLSSYIGYIIGRNIKCVCFVISKDAGFENVCNFWRRRGVKVKIFKSIAQSLHSSVLKKSEIKSLLSDLDLKKDDINFIKDLLFRYIEDSSNTLPQMKSTINTELCRKFGSERTKDIYSAIKPLIK